MITIFILTCSDYLHLCVKFNIISIFKIFRTDKEIKLEFFRKIRIIIHNSKTKLYSTLINIRSYKNVIDVYFITLFNCNLSYNSCTCRTMMPACVRVIPPRTCRRINLISITNRSIITFCSQIIMYLYNKLIFTLDIISYIKFKRCKKTFMLTNKITININKSFIVN